MFRNKINSLLCNNEGRWIGCCVIARLYGVTPHTALPPRFKLYEIYSRFLKQLLTYGVSYCPEHSYSLSAAVILKIEIKLFFNINS